MRDFVLSFSCTHATHILPPYIHTRAEQHNAHCFATSKKLPVPTRATVASSVRNEPCLKAHSGVKNQCLCRMITHSATALPRASSTRPMYHRMISPCSATAARSNASYWLGSRINGISCSIISSCDADADICAAAVGRYPAGEPTNAVDARCSEMSSRTRRAATISTFSFHSSDPNTFHRRHTGDTRTRT